MPDADSAEVIVFLEMATAPCYAAPDCDIEPLETIDATRRFARVGVRRRAAGSYPATGAARPDGGGHVGRDWWASAQRVMEMAVEYARDRKQFDRPIGAYQAVSHRCADMLRETESARSATLWAAWAAEAEPETLPLAASMAKALASDAGWNVTSSALQVHGGIAFTWEHDLHFFLKRAKVDGSLFGSARAHRDRVADLSGLGGPRLTALGAALRQPAAHELRDARDPLAHVREAAPLERTDHLGALEHPRAAAGTGDRLEGAQGGRAPADGGEQRDPPAGGEHRGHAVERGASGRRTGAAPRSSRRRRRLRSMNGSSWALPRT